MSKSVKAPRKSLSRKISIIVFLPIIVITWMTGWALTQIGDRKECANINQIPLLIHTRLEAHEKELRDADEEPKITNKQIIA